MKQGADSSACAGPVQVPQARAQRDRLRRAAAVYAVDHRLVPPLSFDELNDYAGQIIAAADLSTSFEGYVMVLLGNAVWASTVAAIPYDRRLLLLPQCLRELGTCEAEQDAFGLLCNACDACPIGRLQGLAEELGYVVLVAEGTTVVTRLLQQGKVEAVVGVSCLGALAKSFSHLVSEAIPGVAIPLLRDGCDATTVDADWVEDAIRAHVVTPAAGRLDVEHLRQTIQTWFEKDALAGIIAAAGRAETADLAVDWLARSGKRWRPLLAVAVFQTLRSTEDGLPSGLTKLAVAVECFHKASLIHDDIEDDDDTRYGAPTLHCEHGVAISLNVGDFLLGEGYRLISQSGVSAESVARMLAVAAQGHCDLCLGQGAELFWMQGGGATITVPQVLDIFRHKTSPAFEVALRLGAIAAGADETVCRVLHQFSEALGVAYQIRDDLADVFGNADNGDAESARPSLLLALAWEHGDEQHRTLLQDAWSAAGRNDRRGKVLLEVAEALDLNERADKLLDDYRNEAIRALRPLENAPLKGLLQRLVTRMLKR